MHNNHQMKKLIQIYYNTYLFDTFSKIALTLEKNLKLAQRKCSFVNFKYSVKILHTFYVERNSEMYV